jgi:hypothetical protein
MGNVGESELFTKEILSDVPDLQGPFDLHIADYKSLLPHVFMADVVCFVLAEVDNPAKHAQLKRLFAHLERGLSEGSEEVKTLIVTSFAENLIGETERLQKMWPMIGPKLRSEIKAVS